MRLRQYPSSSLEDEIRRIPLPVEILLQTVQRSRRGCLPQWRSDGTSRFAHDDDALEEIDAKAPEIEYDEKDAHNDWKNFGNATYMPQKKISIDRAIKVQIKPM